MLATPILRAGGVPGFWKRSLDEFRRQATIAVKMEGLHRPQKPFPLIYFDESGSVERCKLMCDSNIGGYSKASLTHIPASGIPQQQQQPLKDDDNAQQTAPIESAAEPAHALFKGTINIDLPPNKPQVQRSGYAAFRTRDRGFSLFGKLLWDIDPYSYLAVHLKSDGRKYFINIQTESIVPTDLHQHLLPATTPGRWETVILPLNAFVRTNHGMVVEPQKEMLRQKVRSVGVGLIDRLPGPFELRVAGIWATNRPPARTVGREESAFARAREEEEYESTGMMDEVEPRRKRGEPERILI